MLAEPRTAKAVCVQGGDPALQLLFKQFLPDERAHVRCARFLALPESEQQPFWSDLRRWIETQQALERAWGMVA